MTTFFSQLKKEATNIRLDPRERELMRRALFKMLQSDKPRRSPIQVAPSHLFFFSPRLASSLSFALVIAIVGSGTAYAAEGAIHGDALYPIKVLVNEEVRAALAVSSKAKAEWHAKAAERRMEEAQALAARGDLTAEVKTELEANFEKHAAEVETLVSAVEKEDPISAADISARFDSSVEAHSALIARLGAEEAAGKDGENHMASENLAHSLRERGKRLARAAMPAALKRELSQTLQKEEDSEGGIAMTLSAAIPVEDADEAVRARIELTASTTLEEAESFLATLKDRLDASTSARTKAQISHIREFIKKLREERGGSRGRERVQRALKDATTVKAFIEAQDKFRDHALLPVLEVDEDKEGETGSNPSGERDKKGEGKEMKNILPTSPPGIPL